MTLVFYNEDGLIWQIRSDTPTGRKSTDPYLVVSERPGPNAYVDVAAKRIVDPGGPPSPFHRFDAQSKDWIADLTEAKRRKWTQIKAKRLKAGSTFVWDGKVFDSNPHLTTMAALGVGKEIEWTLADNSIAVIQSDQVAEIIKKQAEHLNQVHQHGRLLRKRIEAARSLDELEAIEWTLST